jgi:hypothetical protein
VRAGERVGGRGWGREAGGRNDPNSISTCEYMNKKKDLQKKIVV